MTLEKDPQQEDFLQGRMQGNPYNFNEPYMGPLMRDIKNKICRGMSWPINNNNNAEICHEPCRNQTQ